MGWVEDGQLLKIVWRTAGGSESSVARAVMDFCAGHSGLAVREGRGEGAVHLLWPNLRHFRASSEVGGKGEAPAVVRNSSTGETFRTPSFRGGPLVFLPWLRLRLFFLSVLRHFRHNLAQATADKGGEREGLSTGRRRRAESTAARPAFSPSTRRRRLVLLSPSSRHPSRLFRMANLGPQYIRSRPAFALLFLSPTCSLPPLAQRCSA